MGQVTQLKTLQFDFIATSLNNRVIIELLAGEGINACWVVREGRGRRNIIASYCPQTTRKSLQCDGYSGAV
jgi:hypothetical protein